MKKHRFLDFVFLEVQNPLKVFNQIFPKFLKFSKKIDFKLGSCEDLSTFTALLEPSFYH